MRILGIDPGTGRMGFGVVDFDRQKAHLVKYGCISTPAHTAISDRLVIIFTEIKQIIDKFKPDVIAVEKLFFAKNVTTVMSVGEAMGVVILLAALAKVPIVEFTPLQVKQALTGYGRAEKGQIQKMVQVILNMEELPRPDDAADALAIAITCSSSARSHSPIK
ncbi:MAG: crossover junction endodeoxyribonuclease RuvC [bacterium]|nr:crossover junction endodeoxyribonuclease RuvC [bacterium]